MSRFRLALIALPLVFAAGCDRLTGDSPTAPSPSPTGAVSYTALGASDAIGFGGSVVCAPFDINCPNGTGYVQQIHRRFVQERPTVAYLNLGVPGAVLNRRLEDLASSIGRPVPGNFVERQAPFVPPTTTHLTVFAGGNDANVLGQAVRAGAAGANVRGFLDEQIRQWGNDYETLIRRVRERAPGARIVALNLPNMGSAPYVAGNPISERSILQYIAVGLTDRVNALTGQNVLVVDLMCDPRIYEASSFSSDGFHPSDRGYTLMAELTYAILTSGSAPTPSSSCAARSALPPAF